MVLTAHASRRAHQEFLFSAPAGYKPRSMQRALATVGPLLGRVLLSGVFLYSGYLKFVATGRAASSLAGRGFPYATPAAYAAGTFEVVAALLLVFGLRARAAAWAVVLYLALVTYLFHLPGALRGDVAQTLQLLKNAGLAGGMLLIATHGPGPFSADRG
jgi:putative oxidoreductase